MFKHSLTRIVVTVMALALALWAWGYYKIPRGTDLLGGVELRFRISSEKDEVLDDVIRVLEQRADPTGTRNIEIQQLGTRQIRVEIPSVEEEELEIIIERLTTIGYLEFKLADNDPDRKAQVERGIVPTGYILLEKREPDPADPTRTRVATSALVLRDDPKVLTGEELKNVYRATDEYGRPAVGFSWNPKAANLFSQLTGRNKGRQLAIILDGELHSAPVIQTRISERGTITGGDMGFSATERDNLMYVLQSGSLPVSLELEGKSYVGASLGQDSIDRGIQAIVIGGVLVTVFMAVYYLACGLVADFALMLNIVLICGALSLFRATLTLPGLAGLLLTVGMAVDANVLVFERIREEKERGRAITLAVKNGYERAFRTILDANVTTLITALILYRVGTASVKGFAVTLSMGIVCSMFTAVYVSRGIFQTLLDGKMMSQFKMNRLFKTTRFSFLSKALPALVISGVLIAAGVGLLFARGKERLYDTDFLGGSYVQLALRHEMDIADVRERLAGAGLGNVNVTTRHGDEAGAGGSVSTEFGLRFSAPEGGEGGSEGATDRFEETVRELFKDDIDVQEVQVAEIIPEKLPEPGPNATDPYLGFYRITVRFDKDLRREFFVRGMKKAGFDGLYAFEKSSAQSGDLPSRSYTIKLKEKDVDKIREKLQSAFASPIYFKQVEYVGAVVAEEMKAKAMQAILWSLVAIIAYVSVRFGNIKYGLAAVAALIHDVGFTLGAIALFNWITLEHPALDFLGVGELRVNLPVVAGLLTIIGYSLNDTIVVFDRIRENVARKPALTPAIVNLSVNQTLGRTVLTSVTTLLAVLALYILGGQRIHSFALIMIIGVVVGTYSSIFIASPLLLSPREWLAEKASAETT